jgi:CRP/FNR family transcriptional regulator, nitrogen oxide reductase regulator
MSTPRLDAAYWLAKSPLFRKLSEPDLRAIAATAQRKVVAPGTCVFHQGRPAECQYLLLHGRVKIFQVTSDGREVVLRFIGPGEIFGIVSTLGEAVYPASAEAMEESHILGWDGTTMAGLIECYPRIAINALPILSSRIRELQERFRELATESVDRRLACALLRLATQTGRASGREVLLEIPMKRQTLAEIAGTTLYTASRLLSQWERDGVVASGRGRIAIRSMEKLKALAG